MSDTERRHFTRVAFDGVAELVDPASGQQWQTTLIDISLRGALVHRPDGVPDTPEHALTLHLYIGDVFEAQFESRVAHSEGDQLGLQFEQMDLDSASHLHRLVELNLGDPALLERELAELIETDI